MCRILMFVSPLPYRTSERRERQHRSIFNTTKASSIILHNNKAALYSVNNLANWFTDAAVTDLEFRLITNLCLL